jgi:predicted SnoaL-like aldol condensation-catalyzing enzyme
MSTQSSATAVTHKDAAVSFLRLAASSKVREGFQRYIGPGFRHHNPSFRGDAESLMKAMEDNATQNPDKSLEVKLVVEDDDLVSVLSHVHHKPGDSGVAVVHIFRFAGDRVVELWDIGQPVPAESANENGMF